MATSSLDLFLADLDERKGKLPCCEEVSLIQRRVRKVIKTILLEVRKENPFFMTTLVNSGSFYEGTKVGKPDEFDFFIQLDAFSCPEDIDFDELPCSTVAVFPRESACEHFKISFDGREDYDRYVPWPDFSDFEWKKNIKTPFFNLFNSKAERFEAYGMKVVLRYEADEIVKAPQPLAKHGPAYTLTLEWNGGELYKGLKISVDLALAVKINSQPLKVDLEFDSPSGQVLNSLLNSLPYFYAVGSYRNVLSEVQPNFFAEHAERLNGLRPSEVCLRCSQSCLEQLLFRQEFGPDSGQGKCLGLLKVLRDILFPDINEFEIETGKTDNLGSPLGWWISVADCDADDIGKLVSSYVLKTLVLFEWQQNPENELWTGSNLSQRLLNILRSLVDRLKGKKLRSFFYAEYNLFQTVSYAQDHGNRRFLNAASIITILLSRLESFIDLPEYKFENCLEKINHDCEMICRKKKFTPFLLFALWDKFFSDVYFQKVVEKSLRNEGKGKIYDSHGGEKGDPLAGASKVLEESSEKNDFLDIYVQSLLDEIAPAETLVLTNIKVKDPESLSSAVKEFKNIARRRMAEHDNLPSYCLWTQQHWTIEESFYKLTSDEPRKLLQFLFKLFQEDIKMLHDNLMGC